MFPRKKPVVIIPRRYRAGSEAEIGHQSGFKSFKQFKTLERLELFERLFNVRAIQDNALLRRRFGRFFLARYYNRGIGSEFPRSRFGICRDP
jgi:hypothetical protein